jgi:hypothetical protein
MKLDDLVFLERVFVYLGFLLVIVMLLAEFGVHCFHKSRSELAMR